VSSELGLTRLAHKGSEDSAELDGEEQCGGWRVVLELVQLMSWLRAVRLDGRRGVGPIPARYREREGARDGTATGRWRARPRCAAR